MIGREMATLWVGGALCGICEKENLIGLEASRITTSMVLKKIL